MKKIALIFTTLISLNILANSIGGTISYPAKSKVDGVLFIFAKDFNSKRPMPVAVKRIANPTFPLKFTLDQSNTMIPNSPFKGPFTVTARISPSGNAMDKSGIEVKTRKPIEIGNTKVNLSFK